MKGNKLFYAIVILVIAVLTIIISENLSNKSPSESEKKFFPSLSESSIAAISIKDSNDSVRVRRKGDIWVVDAYQTSSTTPSGLPMESDSTKPAVKSRTFQADSASISSVLEKILKMEKGVLISDNQEKQSIFEVDSSKGTLVELWDATGKSLGSFRIGKNGADWSSNYVRMTGSNSVYMVGGSLRYAFFSDHKRWRDKTITSFDKSTVKRISLIRKDGASVAVAKADSGNAWNIVEPTPAVAKTDQIEEILNATYRLNASDFEESETSDSAMGFTRPELTVVIGFSNDATRKIIFGSKNENNKYRVRTDGKEHVFLVNDYDFDKLNKDLEKLTDKETSKDTSEVSKEKKANSKASKKK
jgi:hypothetical protein